MKTVIFITVVTGLLAACAPVLEDSQEIESLRDFPSVIVFSKSYASKQRMTNYDYNVDYSTGADWCEVNFNNEVVVLANRTAQPRQTNMTISFQGQLLREILIVQGGTDVIVMEHPGGRAGSGWFLSIPTNDFNGSNNLTWQEAATHCNNAAPGGFYGGGWSLPTREELQAAYKFKDLFVFAGPHWSSEGTGLYHYALDINDGSWTHYGPETRLSVRCVSTIMLCLGYGCD